MSSPPQQQTAHGDPAIWALLPGEVIERPTLQDRYGGRKQAGIAPSTTSPNVMLFSDPPAGEPFGQFDGWRADGCFHYTGEGQRGDHQMKSGNAAILNHRAEGRALRLFLGTRSMVIYQGEFELAADVPYYTTDVSEGANGPTRNAIVFRLRPLDVRARPSSSSLDGVIAAALEDVPVQEQWTETAFVAPSRKHLRAERNAHALVLALRERLIEQGHELTRLKIVPAGEAKPLFCDLFDRTTNTLYVAKGTVERGAIRMAIGQLLDYRRCLEPAPHLAVLLPSRPRPDLCELLAGVGMEPVWRAGKQFASLDS
ncbi:MAG TPA: hypothetical protein VKG82_00160 [Solirubrobacteraceae bacterium]|nr:hypothetical protein [Solirubrobacteraceae bacterium]